MSDDPSAREQLVAEVMGLGVDDILALCYSFQNTADRLRLYIDVLRRRGGQRAQFASCLICFDLARQGHQGFQTEFVLLADTMRGLAENSALIEPLIGDDPYLGFIWELCQARLQEMDPRINAEMLFDQATPSIGEPAIGSELASFDLLSDDDFDDAEFDISLENSQLWREFDEAVELFLGGTVGVPVYDPDSGFRLHNSRDIERVERFIKTLDSLREYVPLARGFRVLALLFYGTHLRSRSLFGVINQRKQGLLRAGLEEFTQSAVEMWKVAGVFGPLHAAPDAWLRIVDVLGDFIQWQAESNDNVRAGTIEYPAVERLIERHQAAGHRRSGLR
ncbi:MAG: hypothetical protein AAFQ65_07220 [Myxococcota bacterium]